MGEPRKGVGGPKNEAHKWSLVRFLMPPLQNDPQRFRFNSSAGATHGEFGIDRPFLELLNVITSPHRLAQNASAFDICLRRPIKNRCRALTGGDAARGLRP